MLTGIGVNVSFHISLSGSISCITHMVFCIPLSEAASSSHTYLLPSVHSALISSEMLPLTKSVLLLFNTFSFDSSLLGCNYHFSSETAGFSRLEADWVHAT